MPDFPNPFSGMIPDKKMNTRELTRALRLDIAAEQEAIHLYEAQADATNDQLASKVLQDLADEERVHVGELQKLLNIVLENEESLFEEGLKEVDEMAEELQRNVEREQMASQDWYRMAQNKPHTSIIPSKMDLPSEGPDSAQLSAIIRMRDAKTALMCSGLGMDCEELLLSKEDSMAESEQEREERNRLRLWVRDEFRDQKFEDWGGLTDFSLTQKQQDLRKKELKQRFEDYMDAGLTLMWEKLKQASGNSYAEKLMDAADQITDNIIEQRRKAIKLGLWGQDDEDEAEVETEDPYKSTYDGTPMNISKDYTGTQTINVDQYINLDINPGAINDDNVISYTKQAVRKINEAELLLDKAKKIKEKGPEKDNLRKNAALRFLEAYKIYESVLKSNVNDPTVLRIANNKLKSIEDQLIIAGFPKILNI